MRQFAAVVACTAVITLAAPALAFGQGGPPAPPPSTKSVEPRTTDPKAADARKTIPDAPATGAVVGAIDLGVRTFTNPLIEQQKGKLEEYRDLSQRVTVEQLLLRYTPKDSIGTYQISGRKLFEMDKSAWLWANRPGLYDFQVRYDNIVHTLSTTGRSLGDFPATGLYTLPVLTGPTGLAIRPDSIAWRAAGYLAPIRTQWAPIKMSFGFTPTSSLDTRIEVSRTTKRGEKPMGMAFGGANNDAREILEPINQTVQDMRVTQAHSSKYFHLMGSFDYNKFDNSLTSVSSDNPQQAANTATAGAAVGRTALAPSNVAKSGSVTGLVNLPVHTRITATYTRSEFEQNAPFIPVTTNALIAAQLLPLPETSAHGQARTTVTTAMLTSRPFRNFNITARLRSFDYVNSTPSVAFTRSTALNDRSVIAGETTEVRPFSKANTEVNASYLLFHGFHATVGYGTEAWTRDAEIRNVGKTNEKTPRYAVDYTGIWWATLHASYAKGQRRFDGAYTPVTSSENPDARIFDVADRDRERINFQGSITMIPELTFTGSWELRHDLYPHSLFGTQSEVNAMVGGDLDWTPSKFVSVNVGYAKDQLTNYGHFRYRTGSVDSLLKNPTWDWLTHNNDQSITPYGSVTATLLPNKLEVGATWSQSSGQFQLKAMNPVAPAKGTPAQIASATAFDFPLVTQKMTPISLLVRYNVSLDWAITARYQMERYDQTDYRLANPPSPNPVAGGLSYSPSNIAPGPLYTQIGNYYFLSNYYQNYNTGWLTLLINYHPRFLPFGSARSTF